MDMEKIYESTDTFESISKDFLKLGNLFSKYFELHMPKEDKGVKSLKDSKIRVIETADIIDRDDLLKSLATGTKQIADRTQNLYQTKLHQQIDKERAEEITQKIVNELQANANTYGLYIKNADDPYINEVKMLFDGYRTESKILNTILETKNEKDQDEDHQLELIYKDGKLNTEILPDTNALLQ